MIWTLINIAIAVAIWVGVWALWRISRGVGLRITVDDTGYNWQCKDCGAHGPGGWVDIDDAMTKGMTHAIVVHGKKAS